MTSEGAERNEFFKGKLKRLVKGLKKHNAKPIWDYVPPYDESSWEMAWITARTMFVGMGVEEKKLTLKGAIYSTNIFPYQTYNLKGRVRSRSAITENVYTTVIPLALKDIAIYAERPRRLSAKILKSSRKFVSLPPPPVELEQILTEPVNNILELSPQDGITAANMLKNLRYQQGIYALADQKLNEPTEGNLAKYLNETVRKKLAKFRTISEIEGVWREKPKIGISSITFRIGKNTFIQVSDFDEEHKRAIETLDEICKTMRTYATQNPDEIM